MSIFSGHVTVDDSKVPVVIDIDDRFRLLANGTEIAQWSQGEFFISDDGEGVYTIVAENEALRFIPSQPDLFAHWVRSDVQMVGKHEAQRKDSPSVPPLAHPHASTVVTSAETIAIPLSPPSRILFYVLVTGTSALGIWALTRLLGIT